jgi:acetolactate synthase-1/3 small subunit
MNLDSLTVGRTERPLVSRMTLVLEGSEPEARRVGHELRKLFDVIEVDHLDDKPHVSRDLALIKVSVTAESRAQILEYCELFRGRVIDVAQSTITIEATGDETKIEGLVDLLRPFGIVEMVRTGLVAMGRADNVLDLHAEQKQPREIARSHLGVA